MPTNNLSQFDFSQFDVTNPENIETALREIQDGFDQMEQNQGAFFMDSELPLAGQTDEMGGPSMDFSLPPSSVTAGNEDIILPNELQDVPEGSRLWVNTDIPEFSVPEEPENPFLTTDASLDWGSAVGLGLDIPFGPAAVAPVSELPTHDNPPDGH